MTMSKERRRKKQQTTSSVGLIQSDGNLPLDYSLACKLAERGQHQQAAESYASLTKTVSDPAMQALIANDRAALAALSGDVQEARRGFQAALALDERCEPARANLAFLEAEAPLPQPLSPAGRGDTREQPVSPVGRGERPERIKVAILSLLFNWPTTGGGNVHTYELALFLSRAGYDVRHIYARYDYDPWRVGQVPAPLPFASEALVFAPASWNAATIQERFRRAVEAFGPDHILITDSWNFKPLLAEVVRDYRYSLRLQAMECLCPLNNVRLLPEPGRRWRQCPLHQLACPRECAACVAARGEFSGPLHQAERALSGVGTPGYHERLLRAFREAEAVLVVNPLHEPMVAPYSRRVVVAPSGMDPERFAWAAELPRVRADRDGRAPVRLLFAGLIEELMKGFHVLQEACARLWQRRQDFELIATGDPPGMMNAFTRLIGWQSQEELPGALRESDILVMPTIAQEALGRTAVEAMAAGRPVIASRLGGLPFTVAEGVTGLLCEPGDPEDLTRKIEMLLDDAELRQRLGQAGRRRFEEHYAWPVIIERHYRPLLDLNAITKVRKSETTKAEISA
jgi:glycosyltransferase involved in cell wall biosynthesis